MRRIISNLCISILEPLKFVLRWLLYICIPIVAITGSLFLVLFFQPKLRDFFTPEQLLSLQELLFVALKSGGCFAVINALSSSILEKVTPGLEIAHQQFKKWENR